MKVEIHAQHIELSQKLRAYIQEKLQFGLNRFEKHISGVSIDLSDVNGQKSGPNKQCQIQIILTNIEGIIIKDTQANLYLAIDRAMQRAGRSVAWEINHNTSKNINERK